MTELDPIVVLTLFTGVTIFLKTRSVLYGLAGLIFAPFLWYIAVGGAVVGGVLLFPLFYVVWKLIA